MVIKQKSQFFPANYTGVYKTKAAKLQNWPTNYITGSANYKTGSTNYKTESTNYKTRLPNYRGFSLEGSLINALFAKVQFEMAAATKTCVAEYDQKIAI